MTIEIYAVNMNKLYIHVNNNRFWWKLNYYILAAAVVVFHSLLSIAIRHSIIIIMLLIAIQANVSFISVHCYCLVIRRRRTNRSELRAHTQAHSPAKQKE